MSRVNHCFFLLSRDSALEGWNWGTAVAVSEGLPRLLKPSEGPALKRAITYGTFDLLHHGHINLLQRARRPGDYHLDDAYAARQEKHAESIFGRHHDGRSTERVIEALRDLTRRSAADRQLAEVEGYIGSQNLEQAEGILMRLVNLEPEQVEALINLAVVEILRENHALARMILAEVLAIEPDNEIAAGNLRHVDALCALRSFGVEGAAPAPDFPL